jgi:hypothetical protein
MNANRLDDFPSLMLISIESFRAGGTLNLCCGHRRDRVICHVAGPAVPPK